MTAFRVWLAALRPRTLVLALAGIGLGLLLAAAGGAFQPLLALLTVLTAVLLQVLSNLANDYGDTVHGADSSLRVGPERAVQSGHVTPAEMLTAVALSAALAALSGVLLVWRAFGAGGLLLAGGFLLLGAAAIWAAWAYTGSARPYGYAGLGDAMVFIFFGPVAVLGSFFLQAGTMPAWLLLPASAAGLLASAVLNVNNMRDIDGDRQAGKLTVPVRAGLTNARNYHAALLAGAFTAGLAAVALRWQSPWQLLFLLSAPPAALHLRAVRTTAGAALDRQLGPLALTSLLFCLLYGLGWLLAS